jgi:hypothetical protein
MSRMENCGSDWTHYRGVVEWGFRAPDVLALLEHARRWSRPGSPFVGAPHSVRDVGRAAARG